MSRASRQTWLRWAVVACCAAAVCSLPALTSALPVPDAGISAAALRARIIASAHVPFQGYAESTANLGIPALPDLNDIGSLLDGATDQYVWYRSPGRWRTDIISADGETDTYQVGTVTYRWDYGRNLLTRIIDGPGPRLPRPADLLPPELGRRLLMLASGAGVSRLPSRRIAGMDAAGLQVRPGSRDTLISAVDIWADPVTGLPAAVEIFARGSARPVLASRFLELSQSRTPLSVVTPNPAPGVGLAFAYLSEVSGVLNGIGPPLPQRLAGLPLTQVPGGITSVAAYGTGFTRLVVIPLPGQLGRHALNLALRAGAGLIQIRGGTAGLIRTPLLTIVLARSRLGGPVFLLAGPVTPAVLQRAAADVVAKSVILP